MRAVIDEQGRLLGKWNVIDAAIVVLLLLLVPVAYGAYALFRAPHPVITAMTPTVVTQGQTAPIQVTGEHLRAFLRVRIGPSEGTLLIETPTRAEIQLPKDVPVGRHDIRLFDESREVFDMPQAITVVAAPPPPPPPPPPPTQPKPQVDIQAVGAFIGLDSRQAHAITTRTSLSPADPKSDGATAHVLATRPPETGKQRVVIGDNATVTTTVPGTLQVDAIVRMRCIVSSDYCKIGDTLVRPGATVFFSMPGADHPIAFRMEDIRSAATPPVFPSQTGEALVRVRLVAPAEILKLAGSGDVDRYGEATLVSLGSDRQTIKATRNIGAANQIQQDLVVVEGTFRVAATLATDSWQYAGSPLRAGEVFGFETLRYAIGGMIVDVQVPGTEKAASIR